jgi:hypothetical protein
MGNGKVNSKTAMEFRCGLMGQFTRGAGLTEGPVEKESSKCPTGIPMKEIFPMIWPVEGEYSFTMAAGLMERGGMTYSMAMGLKFGLTGVNMKEATIRVRSKDMEDMFGQTKRSTQVTGTII